MSNGRYVGGAPGACEPSTPDNCSRELGAAGWAGSEAGLLSANQRSRRAFLRGTSLVFGAALGAAGSYGAMPPAFAAPSRDALKDTKPFKISLSQSSLHKELAASRLDPLDFARTANGLGIDAIEYGSQFYKGRAADMPYLGELKRRAAGEGVCSLLILVEGEGDFGAPEPKARQRAVEAHKKWVEAAAFLGCHAIRVDMASQGAEDDQVSWVSEGLRRLCEFSEPFGIDVLVENHAGLSARGSWLVEVIHAVKHPRCGSLPDFGNFDLGGGKQYDRYTGVRELMPFARSVSAKSYDFDERGEESSINYPLMLKIVTDAGYHGYVGIDYEGQRLSEAAGIQRTKSLLERVQAQLAARAERR